MDGMSWLFNDGQCKQNLYLGETTPVVLTVAVIDHYYHFAAELLLGTWRVYASLDPDITADGRTTLPPPQRIWFMHQDVNEWYVRRRDESNSRRDKPRFNPTILFNAFPSVSLLYPQDFEDMKNSTSSHLPSAFRMDRALFADRSAAFRSWATGSTARTVANAVILGTASPWWWEPIRRQVLRYAGVTEDVLNRNLEGYGALDPAPMLYSGPGIPAGAEPLAPSGDYKPVVTYISRQSSRRRLTKESHEELVAALEDRAKMIGFELVVVEAERLTKEEQFALAGRTTVS
jgi:hypothetical protein